jgi:hypothetical protein
MVKAGGSAKTDAEIVAHILATAPNSYDLITTLVLGKDLTDKDILKFTRGQYQSYWKNTMRLRIPEEVAGIAIPLRHTR